MRFISLLLCLLCLGLSLPVLAKSVRYEGSFKAHNKGVHDLVISVDQRTNQPILATAGGDASVNIWNAKSLKHLQSIKAIGFSHIFDISFMSSTAQIAVAPHAAKPVIIDAFSGRILHTITGHVENVPRLLSTENWLFTAGSDDRVNIWNPNDWALHASLPMKSPVALAALQEDPTKLITASLDGLQLWDTHAGIVLRTYEAREEKGGYNVSLAMHPKRPFFATGDMPVSGRGVRLWDLSTGTVIKTLSGIKGFIWRLTFSPDGSLLVATAHQGQTVVWDIETSKVVFDSAATKITRTLSSAFSADGQHIFIGDLGGNVHRLSLN